MNTLKRIIAWIGTFGSSLERVACVAHALAGFVSVAVFGWIGGVIILGPWGITKEAYLDPKYESAPFFWDGFWDLVSYAVGVALGLLWRYSLVLLLH